MSVNDFGRGIITSKLNDGRGIFISKQITTNQKAQFSPQAPPLSEKIEDKTRLPKLKP